MELIYDEEKEAWVEKPEPYKVIEVATEETYKTLLDALDLRREFRELGAYKLGEDARFVMDWINAVNRLIEQYASVPSKRESEDDG